MQGSFDDTKGSLAVQQCATEHSRAELEEAAQRTAHYLALGAAGALLAYLQQVFIFCNDHPCIGHPCRPCHNVGPNMRGIPIKLAGMPGPLW